MSRSVQPVDLGILLALAYQEFVRELRDHHAEHGFNDLGRSDGYVFRALANGPLTVSELAARLGISKQGAAQIIDDMRRRGYVHRRPDPHDARAQLLLLTDRGEAALATARRFHHTYERRLIRTFGAAAVATLRTTLEAMGGGDDAMIDPQLRAMYL